MLRHPRHLSTPRDHVERGEVALADHHRARLGRAEPEEERRHGALAGAAHTCQRDDLSPSDLEIEPVQDRRPAIGMPDAHPFEPYRCPGRRWIRAAPSHRRSGSLDQVDDAVGRRQPVGARVELGRERAEGRVQLRCQQEDRERRTESDRAIDQPDPQRDGHQRGRDRRREIQDGSGHEGDPEHVHRGPAILLARLVETSRLRLGSVERTQRRKPADHINEVRREPCERFPASPRPRLGRATDQDHEHGDDRQRDEHDRGGREIDRRGPAQDHEGHQRRQRELGQVPSEVGLEPVHALDRRGGDLRRLGTVAGERRLREAALDQRQPELGENANGGTSTHRLESASEDPACEHDRHQGGDRAPARHLASERGHDDLREHDGVEQDHHGDEEPEDDIDRQGSARTPRPPEEPRIEGAHGSVAEVGRGHPTPEHVVRPALVQQDQGQEHHHHDRHHLEGVGRR